MVRPEWCLSLWMFGMMKERSLAGLDWMVSTVSREWYGAIVLRMMMMKMH